MTDPTPTIRVLYAEDNAQDADLTRSHFAEHAPDFEIEIVGSGERCLERAREGGFDLLLLDHHLPDMDGLDVLRALSDVPIPVVLVTGVGDEELVVKALRQGAVNYVPKQGDYLETLPDQLRDAVEAHSRILSQGLTASTLKRRALYVEHWTMDIELMLRSAAESAPHLVVDVVNTCAEALTRLEQAVEYDVMLVDLRMPDQSGLDFVREVKRRHLPLPPFIMLSGKGDESAAIAALKLGAADYIIKREGYFNQLTYTIDRVIARDGLDRVNEQLRVELAGRARSEEAARNSAERYRTILLTAMDGFWLLDMEGHLLEVNEAYVGMSGYSEEELPGMLVSDLEVAESAEDVAARIQRIMDQGQDRFESRIRRKDGTVFDVEVSVQYQSTGEGRMAAFIRDITERKRAESALRESEARHRAILRTAMDGFWLADMEGHLLEVNEGYAEMSGYSEEELLSMRIADLDAAETADETADHMQKVFAEGQDRFESRHRRKDGSVFDIEISVQYRSIDGGRMSAFLRDITERKKAADELAKSLSSMLSVVGRVVEARDPYTAGHERRVAELAIRISGELGMSSSQIEEIRMAALVHDVGKVSVPAEILSKPGKLTDMEFELLKGHSQAGHDILLAANMGGDIAEMVHQHHERCDGSGYPRGLGTDTILDGAKVLAVADVVEAMVSHRPYRPGLGVDAALAEIERGAGLQYDTAVVEACLACFRERGFAFSDV